MSQHEDIWATQVTSYCADGVEYARGTPQQLANQVRDFRTAYYMLLEVVEAHRRFHSKVGCPGLPECFVCAAEQHRDDHDFPMTEFPR